MHSAADATVMLKRALGESKVSREITTPSPDRFEVAVARDQRDLLRVTYPGPLGVPSVELEVRGVDSVLARRLLQGNGQGIEQLPSFVKKLVDAGAKLSFATEPGEEPKTICATEEIARIKGIPKALALFEAARFMVLQGERVTPYEIKELPKYLNEGSREECAIWLDIKLKWESPKDLGELANLLDSLAPSAFLKREQHVSNSASVRRAGESRVIFPTLEQGRLTGEVDKSRLALIFGPGLLVTFRRRENPVVDLVANQIADGKWMFGEPKAMAAGLVLETLAQVRMHNLQQCIAKLDAVVQNVQSRIDYECVPLSKEDSKLLFRAASSLLYVKTQNLKLSSALDEFELMFRQNSGHLEKEQSLNGLEFKLNLVRSGLSADAISIDSMIGRIDRINYRHRTLLEQIQTRTQEERLVLDQEQARKNEQSAERSRRFQEGASIFAVGIGTAQVFPEFKVLNYGLGVVLALGRYYLPEIRNQVLRMFGRKHPK